jgi:hypothetical protein
MPMSGSLGPDEHRGTPEGPATSTQEATMPRYLVQRTFPDGLDIPMSDAGAQTCSTVVDGNAGHGVTWVQSYVSPDKTVTFCIYDGPTPESIRDAAQTNGLPVDRITEVSVLDPYFYH